MTDTQHPTVEARFLVERQGRTFVLYAGCLDLAHRRGLQGIETQLVQVGDEQNGQTWIVRAVATMPGGTFSGIGDASPANVAAAMRTCLPRLAETRAKARALRDAVNIGVATVEELGPARPKITASS